MTTRNEHRDLWWKWPAIDRARVVSLDLPDPFETELGGKLEEIQVSFESWGTLGAGKENVVLLPHALTSDPHATGAFERQSLGWWERLIGPGRPIDTDRFFVVCPNLIGGCYGTTGPRFPGPGGEPYLGRFPLLTPLDMMRVQRLFLSRLGIERVHTVIGPSMGGMIAWEWAIEGGDDVGRVVVVAAPLQTTAHQIGLNWLQRRGIELDLSEDRVLADWGQMIARGVGMLSYRSPVGLEEKFGREWFKEPGSVLEERGMFMIESWLRHHGKRIVQRFDPYTYVLFSRAMDLHDVGRGRGGAIEALDRVRCEMLVIGVSSDALYPPVEVHQGADILNHLGKRVEYAEVRSPHGHDAVFLEPKQIGEILRSAHVGGRKIVPAPAEREVRPVAIGILGAGRVGALFLRLLAGRRPSIREEYGIDLTVRAVADVDPAKRPGAEFGEIDFGTDPDALVGRKDLDVVVALTRGLEAHRLVEKALARRIPVVTPDKALVRRYGARLEKLAMEKGVRFAYHNAIAAGWPLLYAVERPLESAVVTEIDAVLSVPCNSVLRRMEEGESLDEACRNVPAAAETDPELYYSGWDSAQKLSVLIARAKGVRYSVEEIDVRGLYGIDPALPAAARAAGLRIKEIALFRGDGEEPVAAVLAAAVPEEGHLGGVGSDDSVVVLRSGEMGEMVYLGKGSGSLPVATAVLNDLIGIFHARRSWTGRYPRAGRKLTSPRFTRFLSIKDGAPSIVPHPTSHSVPLLDSLEPACRDFRGHHT